MLILALDTTTRSGSVAIVRDGVVVYEQTGDPAKTHGERLPADLMRACEAARADLEAVDLLAVAAGPGSFTGLRIGIAAMQGLAMATGRRIVAVSSLEAIAAAAPPEASRIAAWMDAQRGEVFAQVFECPVAGATVRPVTDAVSLPPRAVLDLHRVELAGAEYHGDGAVRYRTVILDTIGRETRVAEATRPLAGAVGRLAALTPARSVLPHAVVPIYVRRPDAEIARDHRSRQS